MISCWRSNVNRRLLYRLLKKVVTITYESTRMPLLLELLRLLNFHLWRKSKVKLDTTYSTSKSTIKRRRSTRSTILHHDYLQPSTRQPFYCGFNRHPPWCCIPFLFLSPLLFSPLLSSSPTTAPTLAHWHFETYLLKCLDHRMGSSDGSR